MSIDQSVTNLTDRSYKTYLARVQTAKRLRARGHVWNAVLISMSTSTAVAGIGTLADPKMFGENSPFAFASVSVLTLAASLVITGRNYEGRSRNAFDNYRKIQRISTEAESLAKDGSAENELVALSNRYQDLLDDSENHSTADHAAVKESKSPTDKIMLIMQGAATYSPLAVMVIPIYILTIATRWIFQ